ncbi:transcription initiation factor TFIID subunit 7-like isoform X2 [Sus scrofa]|uniref:TATA-box binding protein associated factor 7 like n=2 Tax=Sus scrofa TaxID=9823 RepID=A0A4X1W3R0_PIG|nr:transcription initiation factor TFIID subunit 7-like isoform X2 [Sus scrofa]
MECPDKQQPPSSSENDLVSSTSTSEVTSLQDFQAPVDPRAGTADDLSAPTAHDQSTQTPADCGAQTDGAQTDGATGTQAAAKTPLENLPEEKEMSKSQDEPPHELENQFILRLPLEHASTVRKMVHSGRAMKDKLKIDLSSDGRHAVVEVENVPLAAKLVDLPCVIGSLKTLDKKTFYKTADISQMLVCTAAGGVHAPPEEPVTSTDVTAIRKNEKQRQKKYIWKHGITPPLKNVKKKRFRKTTKKHIDFKQIEEISFTEYIESPDVEKEVKRLLCSDAEAVSARWEVIAEGETKEIESQGSIPSFGIASGMSGYKQGPISPEYNVLREVFSESSSNSDNDEDEDEDDEEEEDDYDDVDDEEEEEEDYFEEDPERELQAKFIESGQYEAKEGTSSVVMEIQKRTHYVEKKLQQIRCKAQRQKDLIKKVENLTLKSHFQSVLEQLKLQEKQKSEQLISLREQLNYFLEK